ncbi:MAG: hemerythrin domain-containing protein [Ferruginibacter sp.]
MKRHPALAHLSRDHHGALILARLLQQDAPAFKGLPVNTKEKAEYAINFYHKELISHFTGEEKALQLVIGVNEHLDGLIQNIFREHQELHASFEGIKNNLNLPAHLDELGKFLEIHVRKEERELFPLIEQSCNEKILEAIDRSLIANHLNKNIRILVVFIYGRITMRKMAGLQHSVLKQMCQAPA